MSVPINNESYQYIGTQPYTYQQPSYDQTYPQQPQFVYTGGGFAPVDSTLVSGYPSAYDPVKAKSDENTALLLLIVSFFLGGFILWIVIYFMFKKSQSDQARMYAKIAGVLSILSIIPFILFLVLIVIYVIVLLVVATHSGN